MFCKVCKDAGKSETEYNSHYVKNNTGKVLCPTLLNQQCKYCKKSGHTVKFCPELKLKEKNQRREDYFNKQHPEWSEELNSSIKRIGRSLDVKQCNSFAAAFDCDSESDDESEDDPIIDLNETLPVATNYIRSYANVLIDDSLPEVENVNYREPKKVKEITFFVDKSKLKSKCWADSDSDSDSDSD